MRCVAEGRFRVPWLRRLDAAGEQLLTRLLTRFAPKESEERTNEQGSLLI